MRIPAFSLPPEALVALALGLRRHGLSWLDGSGRGELGSCSQLLFGPGDMAVARAGDPDPLALAVRPAPGAGEPSAFGAVLAIAFDAAWSSPRTFGLRRPPRHLRPADQVVAFRRAHAAALVYDHQREEARLGAESAEALAWAERAVHEALRNAPPVSLALGPVQVEDPALHRARIHAALEAIGRGDLYQVNLARPFTASFVGDPLALALAMRRTSPVPLGAYLEGPGELTLVARTMERFLLVEGDRVESRPIKGTVREQAGAEGILLASEKERAEHAMIVDLVRNDLGRIAVHGTVRTPRLFAVEPYAHLRHLVSVVEAEARPGTSLPALLAATFPPASVSGAPKSAAIEHIEALESSPRGFYTGTLGGLGRDGAVGLAVAIRTVELEGRRAGTLRYFAGGGIVSASDPEAELEETELKARAFLDAVRDLAAAPPF
jgi:anthranilate/para-aminobenzoate synthase component I